MYKYIKSYSFLLLLVLMCWSCAEENAITLDPKVEQPIPTDPLDKYLYDEFQMKFNSIVRYKFVNRYVDDTKRVTPADRDLVRPYMEFVNNFWATPYLESGAMSESLIKQLFPAEFVLIGSPIYNLNGTITLGTADSGVRITLSEVNDYDITNINWITGQIHVMQHEFTHIIHQKYDLPDGYQKISEGDYTGTGWTLKDYPEMLRLGFVTPYASNNANEDFAEVVSHLLTVRADIFEAKYLDITRDENGVAWATPEATDVDVVRGKLRIQEKYDATVKYYKEVLEIDFEVLRKNALDKIFPSSLD